VSNFQLSVLVELVKLCIFSLQGFQNYINVNSTYNGVACNAAREALLRHPC
jgi:hypothetical protein